MSPYGMMQKRGLKPIERYKDNIRENEKKGLLRFSQNLLNNETIKSLNQTKSMTQFDSPQKKNCNKLEPRDNASYLLLNGSDKGAGSTSTYFDLIGQNKDNSR